MLDLRSISLTTAEEMIRRKCHENPPPWMDSAEWFVCMLDVEEFRKLLVFDGGRPLSGWQEYSGGSYTIGEVAVGLRNYEGHATDLVRGKRDVLSYERRMEAGEFPQALCLVRTGEQGPIALFETNRRAVALYL